MLSSYSSSIRLGMVQQQRRPLLLAVLSWHAPGRQKCKTLQQQTLQAHVRHQVPIRQTPSSTSLTSSRLHCIACFHFLEFHPTQTKILSTKSSRPKLVHPLLPLLGTATENDTQTSQSGPVCLCSARLLPEVRCSVYHHARLPFMTGRGAALHHLAVYTKLQQVQAPDMGRVLPCVYCTNL